ncbi:MAG: electron transfer flavoprotein subunit beta/FixA family protein [Gammaproteobacteria bacterium]
MKIVVAVKRTLDAYVKVRIKQDRSNVDLASAKMAMNPFCEIAVEAAVRLKEAGVATEIVVVSVGSDKVQEQLRGAMALGADRGIHVQADDELESISIAKLLRAVVDKEQPALVLLGKQAIDSDNNQVGQMLAALCNYPQATFASHIAIGDGQATVSREVDGGDQVVSVTLPAIITTDLRLNEPRYAKLPDIMKAKKKPVEVLTPDQLGVTLRQHLKLIEVNDPPPRKPGVKVGSVQELVAKLRNEAKVIA